MVMASPRGRLAGLEVRRRRDELGMSATELGRRTGMHRNTVLNFENGKLKTFTFETLELFAAVLVCDVTDLLRPTSAAAADPPASRRRKGKHPFATSAVTSHGGRSEETAAKK